MGHLKYWCGMIYVMKRLYSFILFIHIELARDAFRANYGRGFQFMTLLRMYFSTFSYSVSSRMIRS
jgi:hypothetical protein